MMLPGPIYAHLQEKLEAITGQPTAIHSVVRVSGGDISEAFRIQAGTACFFLKLQDAGNSGMFEQEYRGLQVLRGNTTLYVPQPYYYGTTDNHSYLLMEYYDTGNPAANFWQLFAKGLAELHRTSNPMHGFEADNYIGSLLQQNTPTASWPEFYATQRILPLFKLALDRGYCTAADVRQAERLCAKLHHLMPQEKPALLHGDLWSGNFMVLKNGLPAIVDPSVYYGHREMDIAMTLLFGGFDRLFYVYYNDCYRLQDGWKERVALFQLYPLLVHLLLFGGHYYYSVKEITGKYV